MEQNKLSLRSIDEFDADFAADISKKIAEEKAKNSLIPEISSTSDDNEESGYSKYFEHSASDYENGAIYSSGGINKNISEEDFENYEYDDQNANGGSKLLKAGKIAAIIMLALTVLVFVFGCFISIFLDNNGTSIAGYCFNTLETDVEKLNLSKNDLIISKKLEISEYRVKDTIAVPAVSGGEGCDIQIISTDIEIPPEGDIIISTVDINEGLPCAVLSENNYGIIKLYVPSLGGIISFAMHNAIIVCILFVLIAALWCVLLILLEKKSSMTPVTDKEEAAE